MSANTAPAVGAIIQARTGSTRLPRKALLDIGGKTMLERVVDRVRKAKSVSTIIVATTTQPQDDELAAHGASLGVHVSRGSEDDVLDRYYRAALEHKVDVVVRITSDCPLLEPSIVDAVVALLTTRRSTVDYAASTIQRTYPRGLDVEAVPFHVLEQVWTNAVNAHEREHVFPYIHDRPSEFQIAGVANDVDYSHLRWTVDTDDDLRLVRALYAALGDRPFRWTDVLNIVHATPALASMNADVIQKPARD